MKDLSRRDLLRASAIGAAAVAVPMSALAGPSARAAAADAEDDLGAAPGEGPVMFCVQDATRGEVIILHGTSEVVVTDRTLVSQIMRAAQRPGR